MVDFRKRNRRAAFAKRGLAKLSQAAGLPVADRKVATARPRAVAMPDFAPRRASDLPSTPSPPRRLAALSPSTASPVQPVPAKPKGQAVNPRREAAKASLLQRLVSAPSEQRNKKEPPTCKPRPPSTGGDGSSRNFVPWCK